MGLTCLIVDDSREFLASAARLFDSSCLEVVGLASTGADAERLVTTLAPDVALVDVELGDEDGMDLAGKLAAGWPEMRVILISLRDQGELGEMIADSGVAGFLRKDMLTVSAVLDLMGGHPDGVLVPERPAAQAETAAPDVVSDQADHGDLLREQAALRRVATLAAQGVRPDALFSAIARETSRLLGVRAVSLVDFDPETATFSEISATHGRRSAMRASARWPLHSSPLGSMVVATSRPARVDDWTHLPGPVANQHRAEGFRQAIAAPVLIGGVVRGYIGAYAESWETLPAGSEGRLAEFTQLLAIAIANAQARDELQELAESQGALRRVATLVAEGAEPRAVFTAVAVEASRFLRVGAVSLIRWDPQTRLLTKIFGTHGERSAVPDGGQWTLDEGPEADLIVQTGRPVRIDDWSFLPGPVAARHREQGFGQCVAAPIVINGTLWGLISAFGEADEELPPGSELRLADYTGLMASAIANAQARDELRGLAERQGGALRRVATLVAQQAPQETIFNAVAGEASRALGVTRADVGRLDHGGLVTLLGSTGRPADDGQAVAAAFPEDSAKVAARVLATGRSARLDGGPTQEDRAVAEGQANPAAATGAEHDGRADRSAVGAPILVDSKPWGIIVVHAAEALPADAETRLSDFTHLVASSISNVHARDNLIASRARIVTASDETRRRIERNLHDGIQQRLLALALSLRAVTTRSALPPEAVAGLDELAVGLEDVLEEVRIFSQGLHPALLSRAGLAASVRELARRSPVPVRLRIAPGLRRFAEPVEIGVYYVVSEALANAAKHAQATEVTVAIDADDTAVWASVTDDGAGGATLADGSGLIGLVDRVEALGGRLTLDSPRGHGTALSIELPVTDRVSGIARRPARQRQAHDPS
jgi:signal transduction histidine kinase/DNA-binding NarL/FixJ family response regulator